MYSDPAVYEKACAEDSGNEQVHGTEISVCEKGGNDSTGDSYGVQNDQEGYGGRLTDAEDVTTEGGNL